MVIRLRETVQAGLRHPVLGPLVLALLVVLLAFLVLHAAEDGIAGELFACAIAIAAAATILVPPLRAAAGAAAVALRAGRAPPPVWLRRAPSLAPPTALLGIPLRR